MMEDRGSEGGSWRDDERYIGETEGGISSHVQWWFLLTANEPLQELSTTPSTCAVWHT